MSLITFSSTNPSTASRDRRGLTAACRPRLIETERQETGESQGRVGEIEDDGVCV